MCSPPGLGEQRSPSRLVWTHELLRLCARTADSLPCTIETKCSSIDHVCFMSCKDAAGAHPCLAFGNARHHVRHAGARGLRNKLMLDGIRWRGRSSRYRPVYAVCTKLRGRAVAVFVASRSLCCSPRASESACGDVLHVSCTFGTCCRTVLLAFGNPVSSATACGFWRACHHLL